MTKPTETRATRWLVPVSALVIGAALAAIQLARGQTWDAVWFFGIMLAYATILTALSRRSELVALLRGDTADERRTLIHLRASSAAAHILIAVLVGGFVVQLARGADPSPWGELSAIAGVTYLVALAITSRRS